MQNKLFPGFPAGRTGIALLIIRVVMGIAFIQHGMPLITNIPGFAERQNIPIFFAAAAALSQVVGGALLILGLLTPVAAFFLAITMLVAIFKVHVPAGHPFVSRPGQPSWELAGIFLSLSIALILMGPGAYSLDAWLFGRKRQSQP